jgi:hypothetical protein
MISPGSVVAAKRHHYVSKFKEVKALGPENALEPQSYGLSENLIFNRLVRQGILVPVANNRYYLDENKEQQARQQRKRRIMLMVGMILFVIAAMAIINLSNEVK